MTLETDSRLPGATPTGALVSTITFWALVGRYLLVVIGVIFIVPAPWASTAFYRFFCNRTALPDGRRLKFIGRPGDIWYVFVASAVLFWGPQLINLIFPQAMLAKVVLAQTLSATLIVSIIVFDLIYMLLFYGLSFIAFKWAVAKSTSEDDRLKLSFDGGFWAYIGWALLLGLSGLTIIGWAWVIKFMLRWVCRNVHGNLGFEFTGTGLGILGRSIGAYLLCILIIPIPWVVRWYIRWYFSQVQVVPGRVA